MSNVVIYFRDENKDEKLEGVYTQVASGTVYKNKMEFTDSRGNKCYKLMIITAAHVIDDMIKNNSKNILNGGGLEEVGKYLNNRKEVCHAIRISIKNKSKPPLGGIKISQALTFKDYHTDNVCILITELIPKKDFKKIKCKFFNIEKLEREPIWMDGACSSDIITKNNTLKHNIDTISKKSSINDQDDDYIKVNEYAEPGMSGGGLNNHKYSLYGVISSSILQAGTLIISLFKYKNIFDELFSKFESEKYNSFTFSNDPPQRKNFILRKN